jgi:hypothetical protein
MINFEDVMIYIYIIYNKKENLQFVLVDKN